MHPYSFADKLCLVFFAVIIFAGLIFYKKKKEGKPSLFVITGVGVLLIWVFLMVTDQTWAFWKAAYHSDAKRVNEAAQMIDIYSSSIFNNILVSIPTIWLLGAWIWSYLLKDVAKDIIKRENDDSIQEFYFSCLFLFSAQLVIGYYWPNITLFEDIKITNKAWGFIKHILRAFVAVAPIWYSFKFCNRYWGYLKEELEQKKFNDSIYPTLMVAQGTFYTFVGVSAILLIYTGNKDISQILQGLKLAFLTSVIGLLYSIAARFKIMAATKEYYALRAQRMPLDEYDFYVLIKNIHDSLRNDFQNIVENNNKALNVQTEVFAQKIEEVFGKLKEDMATTAQYSQSIKENFEMQNKSAVQLRGEIAGLLEEANGAYSNISQTAAAFDRFIKESNASQLPKVVKDVAFVAEQTNRINNYAQSLYSNIENNLEKISRNSEEIVSWTSNMDKMATANQALSSEIMQYHDAIGELNLPAVAQTLKHLSDSYENLDKFKDRDYTMLQQYNHMLEEQKAAISEQLHLLEDTIKMIRVSQASYEGSTRALSNLAERVNQNTDNVVGAFVNLDAQIRKQSLKIEEEHYKALLEQQKKYMENLEAARNKTLEASLDVTNAVLDRVKNEFAERK